MYLATVKQFDKVIGRGRGQTQVEAEGQAKRQAQPKAEHGYATLLVWKNGRLIEEDIIIF